jgi:hypothetical protein
VKKKKVNKKGRNLRIDYVRIETLKEWEDNPRMNDDAAERLVGLMEEYGFVVPIIATRDGTIRAGHTRYKAAKMRKDETVPVIFVDFNSEEEAQLFSIAENRSHEWSEWHQEKLQELFGDLLEAYPDRAVAMAGFTQIQIQGMGILDFEDEPPASVQEAVQNYEKELQAASKNTPDEQWLWFQVPGKKAADRMVELYGLPDTESGSRRELDWKKIKPKLTPKPRRK